VRRRSCGASLSIPARAAAVRTTSHSTLGDMPSPHTLPALLIARNTGPRVMAAEVNQASTLLFFGGLVPYGRVWILGANEATSFVPTTNVTIGGKSVPAGHYSLFAVPQSDAWTLIVNKTPRENIGWMSFYPGEASDMVRVPVTTSKLPSTEENFTISFVRKGSACEMRFDWEQTRASVTVQEGKP